MREGFFHQQDPIPGQNLCVEYPDCDERLRRRESYYYSFPIVEVSGGSVVVEMRNGTRFSVDRALVMSFVEDAAASNDWLFRVKALNSLAYSELRKAIDVYES